MKENCLLEEVPKIDYILEIALNSYPTKSNDSIYSSFLNSHQDQILFHYQLRSEPLIFNITNENLAQLEKNNDIEVDFSTFNGIKNLNGFYIQQCREISWTKFDYHLILIRYGGKLTLGYLSYYGVYIDPSNKEERDVKELYDQLYSVISRMR